MRLGSSTEAVALDSTLEAFTLGGAYDIHGLANGKQTGIKLLAKFQVLRGYTLLQFHFTQYFERAQFRSWTTLALLLPPELILNLFVFFFCPGFLSCFSLCFFPRGFP